MIDALTEALDSGLAVNTVRTTSGHYQASVRRVGSTAGWSCATEPDVGSAIRVAATSEARTAADYQRRYEAAPRYIPTPAAPDLDELLG